MEYPLTAHLLYYVVVFSSLSDGNFLALSPSKPPHSNWRDDLNQ